MDLVEHNFVFNKIYLIHLMDFKDIKGHKGFNFENLCFVKTNTS